MPRYFFNIFGGEDIHDLCGTELANAREIRLHMVSTALALFEAEKNQKTHWQMEALDERGCIVSTMTFGIEADPAD